jgi:hypothetical protein
MQHRIHGCCRVQTSSSHCRQSNDLDGERKAPNKRYPIFRSGFNGLAVAGALLLPKCPLCIIAWAAAFGLGAAGQQVLHHWLDPRYRAVLIFMLTLPLLLQLAAFWRPLAQRIRSSSAQRQRPLRS